MRTRIRFAIALGCGSLVSCSALPYYGTASLTDQGGDPNAQIDPSSDIRMAEGSAASAHIELDSMTGGTMSGDIQSQDPSVLTILHTPRDGDTYVFLAKKAGLAEVIVSTNGFAVRSTNAVVTAPPALASDGGVDADVDAGGSSGADAGDGGETDAADHDD